jgi:hypothetical protein
MDAQAQVHEDVFVVYSRVPAAVGSIPTVLCACNDQDVAEEAAEEHAIAWIGRVLNIDKGHVRVVSAAPAEQHKAWEEDDIDALVVCEFLKNVRLGKDIYRATVKTLSFEAGEEGDVHVVFAVQQTRLYVKHYVESTTWTNQALEVDMQIGEARLRTMGGHPADGECRPTVLDKGDDREDDQTHPE